MPKKSKIKFQAPKGMRDILPDEQKYWQKVDQVAKNIAQAYGFERIDTPILEETALYVKGTILWKKKCIVLRLKGVTL
jgi:histidyl-tRNA synthetase